MENDGATGQRQKELSISLAASSMINGSDVISEEAYRANLKRIQEVKEMVRRLEMNNESAHRNFVANQLEKRARDGREAEVMLTQLRNQPALPGTVQFTNSIPSDKSEVILPTTATLVEVPESHSSYLSPASTTTSPQTLPQGRPAEDRWNLPAQVLQPYYNPNAFRYYTPPSTVYQPQHSATPRSQAPINGQMSWYTVQNVPPQSGIHNTLPHQPGFQSAWVQRPAQSRDSYPSPVVALPAADTVSVAVQGYYTSPSGLITTTPAHGDPSTGSPSTTYREPGFQTQSAGSRPLVTTHQQPQNLSSLSATPQVQLPLHDVPVPSIGVPSVQPLLTQFHPKPAESQSRLFSTAVSNQVTVSEFQHFHKPPPPPPQRQPQQQLQPQPQHHQQQPQHHQQQPQPRPQPPLQPQQLLQPPPRLQQQSQFQPQRSSQLPLHPQQHSQQPQELPSQSSLQPRQIHLQAPSRSAERTPSTSVSQLHTEPSLARNSPFANTSPGISQTQPSIVQEQRGAQPRTDQATFIKLFQIAIQRGTLHLKAFLLQAKASGISDEWFRAAINSVPRDVWDSVTQVNPTGPTFGVSSSVNVPQQQVSTIPGKNMPVDSARPPLATTPLVQTTPATQQVARSSTPADGRTTLPAPGQISGSYAVQLQYYAEQATKLALTTQVANYSATPPGNLPSIQKMVATPTRDVPQAQIDARTPKDANKSTLARDILRSLGKIVPRPRREVGDEPMDKANNREDIQLPVVNAAPPVSDMASPELPVVPPAIGFVRAESPSIPQGKASVQAGPQHVPSNPSTAKLVLKEKSGQAAVEGPIMIDLTLDDSDKSTDGKGQEPEPTFPIQTSTSAATSLRPASPTNTTNHTPLLENLSLEEPLVDVAADGNNVDVRMCSPPLSLVTKEGMESELLYPSLSGTELVSPTFEPSPREASEHPLDGQLPLFLPSPPVSPAHTEPPETDLETTNDEAKSQLSLKRRSISIEDMEVDTASLTLPRVRKRRKLQVYVLVPPAPLYVKKAFKKMKERATGRDIDSDLEGVEEGEETQYSHLEQLLIEESKSRLLERRCRWLNCGTLLNCAANLFAHLKIHTREEDLQAPFLCRWISCQRQFDVEEERDAHLEKHTIRPLPCPFAGCDEQFNRPVEVMQHEVQHQKAEHREPLIRKPAFQPAVPAIPARLGPPPYRLPSHRVIPRRVVKCRISAERHATMGPWVLWNIFSPVDLYTRKQNASMRGRPTRQAISYDIDSYDARRDDYDFLQALSPYPAKNPQLDDLDSTLITISAARGLTLWGSGSVVNSAAGTTAPEENPNADAAVPTSAVEAMIAEVKSDESEVPATSRRQSGQSVVMGEEDAVERMLIL